MANVTLQFDLPDSLAREAEKRGLLGAPAIEAMLREALRTRRIEELFAGLDRLDQVNFPPLTDEEVRAEIDAVRRERRADRASGD